MAILGNDIHAAAKILSAGNLVAIPTETVYGLAANALDPEAVVKIFQAKNRPAFDPLIVHVPTVAAFEKYAQDIPEKAIKLAEKVCPGPVTFVLRKRKIIPEIVTSGHPTVGLRVPRHPLSAALLQQLPFPLAAPSANPFGFVSPTSAAHVQQQLGDKIDYILDGGQSAVGIESTIIDFSEPATKVLRLGGLSVEFLEEILQEKIAVKTSSSNPSAPGMLSSHYNPGKPIFVGENVENLLAQWQENDPQKRVGILAFQHKTNGVDNGLQQVLSPSGNLAEAAQNLFAALRAFHDMPIDAVLAEWVPNSGLGRAINDRLKRAAAK